MHDPMTVAWELRLPLPWKERKTYRGKDGKRHPRQIVGRRRWESLRLLTIWHHDPETDGSDDSCYVGKRLGRLHKDFLDHSGSDEARHPWFRRERGKEPASPADAETLLRGAFWWVARCTRLHRPALSHKRITFARCAELASELLHNPVDNVRSSLCLLPGWHTNEPGPNGEYPVEIDIEDHEAWEREDRRELDDPRYPRETSEWKRKDLSQQFFHMIARILSRESARWWQFPRWHFWHWGFQVHPWQRFKRRFIERCVRCGVRFKGASVFTDWEGTQKWCETCYGVRLKGSEAKPAEVAP